MGLYLKLNDCDENIVRNFYTAKKVKIDLRNIVNFKISRFVNFNDEIWDFNYLNNNNRDKRKFRMDFRDIPEPFVFYIKICIINSVIISKNSISSAKSLQARLKNISKVMFNFGITDIRLINKNFVEEYLEQFKKHHKPGYVSQISLCLRRILTTIEEIEGINFRIIINYLNEQCKEQNSMLPTTAVNDYIPDYFLDQIVSFALQDLENENISINHRIVACLIVILAETGMRSEELTVLESNKLDCIGKYDHKLNYLIFLTFKIKENKVEAKETYTYLSENAVKAYKRCESLVDLAITNLGENARSNLYYYLYTGEESSGYFTASKRKILDGLDDNMRKFLDRKARRYLWMDSIRGLPKRGGSLLIDNMQRFFARHYKDFDLQGLSQTDRKKIKSFKITSLERFNKFFSVEERSKMNFDSIKDIEFPYVNPHMFRVTVCTKLFMAKVPIDFIIKHLNHLSEDMTCYYNKSFEFVNYLEDGIKLFASITTSEGIIETDPNKINNEFMKIEISNKETKIDIEKINKFLISNKLSIKDNIDKIINILEKVDTTIAENEFGICIKSAVSGICERKKYFSSLSDNYNIGIVLPSYKHINYSYERFHQKLKIVHHNKKIADNDSRYINEYQRELNALNGFINKTLKFQINLLRKDIEDRSIEEVMKEYPHLEYVINNLNKIKEEISQWKDCLKA